VARSDTKTALSLARERSHEAAPRIVEEEPTQVSFLLLYLFGRTAELRLAAGEGLGARHSEWSALVFGTVRSSFDNEEGFGLIGRPSEDP
jgi:hypothetical protein